MKLYSKYFKRIFDILASGFALVLLIVPMVIVTISLHFANKGSGVFFYQERPGKCGKLFKLVKYKTMTDETDATGKLLPDAQRLTKIGRIIRSTSIDELPQLWNVFIGDMSIVGPRPLLVKYLPRYSKEQARRHEVRPGITGWAQVNGRNNISWDKKFELDVFYVDNLSLKLDIKVIFMTLKKVFLREDINTVGRATTTEFFGTESESEN